MATGESLSSHIGALNLSAREVEHSERLAFGHHGDTEVGGGGGYAYMATDERMRGIRHDVHPAPAQCPAVVGGEVLLVPDLSPRDEAFEQSALTAILYLGAIEPNAAEG